MSKGVKSKQTERASGFAKEIFGMGLLLFSILSLLCLVTGDVIFYTVGSLVQGFFLGLFGYFSFVVLAVFICLGLRCLLDRAIFSKKIRRGIFLVCFFAFSVMAIVQTAVFYDRSLNFGQNFSNAYGQGKNTLLTTSPLGGVANFIINPLGSVMGKVGCYVVFALTCLMSSLLLFKKQIGKLFTNGKDGKNGKNSKNGKKATQQKQNKQKTEKPVKDKSFEEQPLSEQFMEDETNAETVFRRPAYMDSLGDFGIKTKRDYKNEGRQIDVFSGDFSFRNSKGREVTTSQTYSQKYRDDLSADANYILTPPPLNPESIGQSPMRANNPSNNSQNARTNAPEYDVNSLGGSVYTVKNDDRGYSDFRREPPKTNGGYEPESRGGLFDNYQNNSKPVGRNETSSRAPSREPFSNEVTERLGVDRGKRSESDALSEAVSGFTREVPESDRFTEADMPNVSRVYNPAESSQNRAFKDSTEDLRRTNVPNMNADTTERTQVRSDRGTLFGETGDFSATTSRATPTRGSEFQDRGAPTRSTVENKEESLARTRQSRSIYLNDVGDKPANGITSKAEDEKIEFTSSTESELSKFSDEFDPNEGYASIEDMPNNYRYIKPSTDLLEDAYVDDAKVLQERQRLMELAKLVEANFAKRGTTVRLENIVYGMTVTRFEYTIPTETSVKVFTQNQGDIAVWLHANGDIRILAPIPGTSRIGIEVPNQVRSPVGLKELICSPQYRKIKKDGIYIPAGKNVMAESVFLNLTDMPHLLIAGATGKGKSVFLNAMLVSLLYTYSPEDLRIVIVDPKQLEFVSFEGIPHLMFNKIITQPEEAAALLNYLVKEMEDRYALFAKARVKKIANYNEVIDRRTTKKLPYIIVLIDEFADLMMKNPTAKKDMDQSITRLAQLARAAGISLVFATQRPTTDVIDGTIKNNFPARICFQTADYTNSQVVIGENGAEKLLGKGDLLFKIDGPTERAQGALVQDSEINRVVSFVNSNNKCYYDKKLFEYINKMAKTYGQTQASEKEGQISMDLGESGNPADMPVVYRRAVRLVIVQKTTSKSMLQTKLGIGYNKAARIIDWMENQGFISCVLDNKQREIRIDRATYEQVFNEPFEEDYTK